MKSLIPLIIFFLYASIPPANAQCGSLPGNTINTLPVCGLYGDANGNSNWNWELTNVNDPNYCQNWYALTGSSGFLTPMGSPFVNAPTAVLDIISQQQDYTKAKGWELLRRDFGCSHVAAYPYFVLYNKYSGLMRVFVYVAAGQENYQGIAAEIKPNGPNKYPATTAFSDTIEAAPDKYLSLASGHGLGLGMVSVGELAGQAGWSLIEFTPSFDPNIQHSDYTGALLEIKIYGVTSNNMYATIRGGSATGPSQLNYTYKPTTNKIEQPGGLFDFKGVGEKFTRISTAVSTIRTEIKNAAQHVSTALGNPTDPLLKKEKDKAEKIKAAANDNSVFLESFNTLAGAIQAAGSIFKIFSTITGLFSGSGSTAGSPSYTTYDLTLQGTITTRVIISSFVLRVPGTIQTDNSNATYYKCPMGIVNIKNTPQADKITYNRGYGMNGQSTLARHFVSYKIKNDLVVSFNDGAGLDLVSAQAAFIGEIQLQTAFPFQAFYNIFESHHADRYNHMRTDFETGRLETKHYDTHQQLHIFQTPYTNIECLKGLAFNVVEETKVYLQVKIVLKKKNDPTNTPIVFINNYAIETTPVPLIGDATYRENLIFNSKTTLPPYRNYTELPLYISQYTFANNQTFTTTNLTKADHTITTNNKVIAVNSGANVTFSAGGVVVLDPGFEANPGSIFEAKINDYGYTLTCITPLTEAYVHGSACYNTIAQGHRKKPSDPPAEEDSGGPINIYPTLSSGLVYVSGKNLLNSQITIVDASGRTVMSISNNSSDHTFQLHLDHLGNGIYFIKIDSPGQSVVKKLILQK